jgi:hypothetical protein
MQKNAWTRKYNVWRNQEQRRTDAEIRWATRQRMASCEARGEYAFQADYEAQVQRIMTKAEYLPPKLRRDVYNSDHPGEASSSDAHDTEVDPAGTRAGGASEVAVVDSESGQAVGSKGSKVQEFAPVEGESDRAKDVDEVKKQVRQARQSRLKREL